MKILNTTMSLFSRLRIAAAVGCFIAVVAMAVSSCTPTCDYPSVRVAKLRPVNAMPDQEAITIWINGRLFKSEFNYNPTSDFGYISQFADGTPLASGQSLIVITSDAAGKDTIISTTLDLTLHLQTMVVIGRAHSLASEQDTKKVLLLDDEIQKSDPTKTYFRFIHAIPDVGSLDIYWQGTATPNLRLGYGQSIDSYYDLTVIDTIKATEAGKPNNVIVLIPYKFNQPGFVVTSIFRGRTAPVSTEYTPSVFLLSDVGGGNYITNIQTFGVRIFNASRAIPKVSLLINGAADNNNVRANYPGQEVLLDIPPDSLSNYLGLRPEINGNTSTSNHTTYVFTTNNNYFFGGEGFLDSLHQAAINNDRFTFVAIERAKLGEPEGLLDHLILTDTMSVPAGGTKTRVRIIMANPDHQSISVTIGANSQTLPIRQVTYFDIPVGANSLEISDGAKMRTVAFDAVAGRPISIYLLPDQSNLDFPVAVINE